jgi:hypothetical protein
VSYSTLRLCSGGGAYEAVPRPRLRLDLPALRARLEAQGIPVVDARVLLIVRLEREVTVSRDGRILIKTRDAAESERLLGEIARRLELPLSGAPSAERGSVPSAG